MAYIKKLTDKPRTLPWRAQVRRKGHKAMVKMFKTKPEAERWATEQERTIRLTGLPLTIDDLKKHTVGDIVCRYLKEVTPTKGSRVSETAVLKKFLNAPSALNRSHTSLSKMRTNTGMIDSRRLGRSSTAKVMADLSHRGPSGARSTRSSTFSKSLENNGDLPISRILSADLKSGDRCIAANADSSPGSLRG